MRQNENFGGRDCKLLANIHSSIYLICVIECLPRSAADTETMAMDKTNNNVCLVGGEGKRDRKQLNKLYVRK